MTTQNLEGRLIAPHGIAILVYRILLGTPEILFAFIGLSLPLLLDRSEAFSLLISHPGRFDGFAAGN